MNTRITSEYRVKPLPFKWDPLLLAAVAQRQGVFLDSGPGYGSLGQISLFGCCPFQSLIARESKCMISRGSETRSSYGNPLEVLESQLAEQVSQDLASNYPAGAAMGYLAYGLGRFFEDLPCRTQDDLSLPDLLFYFFDAFLVYDHQRNRTLAVVKDDPAAQLRLETTLAQIERVRSSCQKEHLECAQSRRRVREYGSTFSRAGYRGAVRTAKKYIAAGDVYQVNLSQRFWAECPEHPVEIYRQLRAVSPAPFGAFIGAEDHCVLSVSPERFLKFSPATRRVETRPIKGTRPRGTTWLQDEALRCELECSAKDAAEHVMIVDLERNDLGRVAEFGSVRVSQASQLETFATVHHLISTIEARVRQGCGTIGLLRATFPGGSITGAPKIRAMQIIDELEPVSRGVCTGSIGSLDLNVAIRTLVIRGGLAYYSAGGGIVADSDPETEYRETLDKAQPFFAALNLNLRGEN